MAEIDRAKPIVLARVSTIDDLTNPLQSEPRRKPEYAVRWGTSDELSGQHVGRQHRLEGVNLAVRTVAQAEDRASRGVRATGAAGENPPRPLH